MLQVDAMVAEIDEDMRWLAAGADEEEWWQHWTRSSALLVQHVMQQEYHRVLSLKAEHIHSGKSK